MPLRKGQKFFNELPLDQQAALVGSEYDTYYFDSEWRIDRAIKYLQSIGLRNDEE